MKILLIILTGLFFFNACTEYEYVLVETEVIEEKAPYNLSYKTPERAIRDRYRVGKIDSLTIVNSTPIGTTSNWFSGDKIFYELEYRLVISHYNTQVKE